MYSILHIQVWTFCDVSRSWSGWSDWLALKGFWPLVSFGWQVKHQFGQARKPSNTCRPGLIGSFSRTFVVFERYNHILRSQTPLLWAVYISSVGKLALSKVTAKHDVWPWSTKAVSGRRGICVAIAKKTLHESKLLIFLLCQTSLRHEDI